MRHLIASVAQERKAMEDALVASASEAARALADKSVEFDANLQKQGSFFSSLGRPVHEFWQFLMNKLFFEGLRASRRVQKSTENTIERPQRFPKTIFFELFVCLRRSFLGVGLSC